MAAISPANRRQRTTPTRHDEPPHARLLSPDQQAAERAAILRLRLRLAALPTRAAVTHDI